MANCCIGNIDYRKNIEILKYNFYIDNVLSIFSYIIKEAKENDKELKIGVVWKIELDSNLWI